MNNYIENIFASHELYYSILTPLCREYELSHTELIVLLCLVNHPEYDTATDIVDLRKLTKSAVSVAVRSLQEKGLIVGEYTNGNFRSIHLRICDSAVPVIEAGKKAQQKFFDIMLEDFADEDKKQLKCYFEHITSNINKYNKS